MTVNKPRRTTFRTRLDEMVSSLRDDILTGKFHAGDYLPSELALVEQYQLSKNSVRKGLKTLLSQGLIEKVPRVGTRVADYGQASTITLKFGYYHSLLNEANILSLIDDFQRLHPNIIVRTIPLPAAQTSPHIRESMEREMIDVVTVNNQNYELFTQDGSVSDMLEPLEPREGVYPFLSRPFSAEGNLYVQPFLFSPIVLCYNKKHFDEAKLPEPDSSWTWDDIRHSAGLLSQSHDRIGLYFHMLSMNRWPLFLLQSGVTFRRGKDGKLQFNDEAFREGLEASAGLFNDRDIFPSYLSENDSDPEQLFLKQKASMIITSYFSLNSIRQADFAYDIAPAPFLREAKTLLLTIGLAIHKESKHKQAAKALVDYLMSNDAQLHIRKHTLSIPALKTAAEWKGKENVVRPSRFFMYRDIIPTFRIHTDMNVTFRELEEMRQELILYWARLDDFDAVRGRLEEKL